MGNGEDLKFMIMGESEKKLLAGLTEAQRYRYFLGRMQFLKYELGKENLLSADCSGSVCLALLLATGCAIRVTADDLYRKYFTKSRFSDNDNQAVFFITDCTRKVGYKVYKKDECAHVAGVCGKDVVLNCVEPYSVLRSISDMKDFYNSIGYKVVVRGLNRMALQKASNSGADLFDADLQFLQLRTAEKIVRRIA